MVVLVILFGLFGVGLLNVLVGLVGSKRKIGFGWALLLSCVFSPLVGLIFCMLSDKLPEGSDRKWGCLGTLIAILMMTIIVLFVLWISGWLGGSVLDFPELNTPIFKTSLF